MQAEHDPKEKVFVTEMMGSDPTSGTSTIVKIFTSNCKLAFGYQMIPPPEVEQYVTYNLVALLTSQYAFNTIYVKTFVLLCQERGTLYVLLCAMMQGRSDTNLHSEGPSRR